ncbi:MAG: hypothetical protein ACP5IB_08615 [Thermoplasmata archaeon]
MNNRTEIGRHTKIFGPDHEVDFLNGKGYAVLPYSEIDHSLCDPKKACDHKTTSVYEIVSSTMEILPYNGDIVADIFRMAVELRWLTQEEADRKQKEWQSINGLNTENRYSAERGNEDVSEIIRDILEKNEKFNHLFMTGDYTKYGNPSNSEADEYIITLLGAKACPIL